LNQARSKCCYDRGTVTGIVSGVIPAEERMHQSAGAACQALGPDMEAALTTSPNNQAPVSGALLFGAEELAPGLYLEPVLIRATEQSRPGG